MTRVSPQLSVDAAEHFYSESGLHGSSARTLARKIGITLGAIIRHFGSKEDIVLEINRRYAIPINAERNAMLDAALKRSGGSPLPLKDIVAALVIPLSRPIVAHILRTGTIPKAFARLFSEPLAIRRRIYRELFIATVARIETELGRSLPELSAAERRRRLNVAGNAMLGTFLRLDLIIEPECPSGLERAIRDCLQSLQDMTCAGLLAPAPDSAIALTNDSGTVHIHPSDITHILSDCDYTRLYLKGGQNHYIRRPMQEWEQLLPDTEFVRVHRGVLVNRTYAVSLVRLGQEQYGLRIRGLEEPLPVSRRRLAQVSAELGLISPPAKA